MARAAFFFTALLAVLLTFFIVDAADSQVIDAGTRVATLSEIPVESLVKRSCEYNGCRCTIGPGGLVCHNGDVYQCAPNGNCCYYGPRDSCRKCGKLRCP